MREKKLRTVDIVIPTYHPDDSFVTLIQRLLKQSYPINKIIIMNTEESIWISSKAVEKLNGIENLQIHHVTKKDFDHGRTRDLGICYSDADIVICMTQDAIPKKNSLVARLVSAFDRPAVAMAYACQLPAKDCGEIESFTRCFNYPDYDIIKSKQSIEEMGIKAFFASNVCAAYDRNRYHQLGGFIRRTIFNEDMIFAAKVINNGYEIAYCSKALVVHSHNYSCFQQFRRNFDLAVSQADHPEVFAAINSQKEGIRLIKSTARYLRDQHKAHHIPKLIMISGFKFLGYQCGKHYEKLPKQFVRFCSMNRTYWE